MGREISYIIPCPKSRIYVILKQMNYIGKVGF